MSLFDQETRKLLKALQTNEVRYLLIGGYAVNLHGSERPASDLDIWLKDTLENRQRLRKAFAICGMGDYPMIERMQFVPGWTDFQLNNAMRLDILTELKGLEAQSFDECFNVAPVAELAGIIVPFLQIGQLIENKKATDRPKDLNDIIALEEIKRLKAPDREPPFISRQL